MELTLSFAIMTHNERAEFGWLMDTLRPFISDCYEVVVLDDYSSSEMVEFIKSCDVNFYQRALNKDFAAQRNYLKDLCRGEYIFVLDPDELPPNNLLKQLPAICAQMKGRGLDACSVPRYSKVIEGHQPVDARTIPLTNKEILDYPPDAQIRIFRNCPEIFWSDALHERLNGLRRVLRLPNGIDYALLHVKTTSRLKGQGDFYTSVAPYSIRNLANRLGITRLTERLGAKRRIKRLIIGEPEWMEFDIE
jgi:glycosyltransferase involved in cell wall biosynthesis